MCRPDKSKMGKAITDQLGLGRNFFYNLRRDNPSCLAYIKALHPDDLVIGYNAYVDEKREVSQKACDIYIELEDEDRLRHFGQFLVRKGIYSDYRSYSYTHRTIFKVQGITKHTALLQTKEIIKVYEEFKEQK